MLDWKYYISKYEVDVLSAGCKIDLNGGDDDENQFDIRKISADKCQSPAFFTEVFSLNTLL